MEKKIHRMCLKVKTPIFIGNGEKLSRKDFIRVPKEDRVINSDHDQIIVPDFLKLYEDCERGNSLKPLINFMKGTHGDEKGRIVKELYPFLSSKPKIWHKDVIPHFTRYRYPVEDITEDVNNIQCFIKNGLGEPYVPGSSLKGMFRTALLFDEIVKRSGKYSEVQESITSRDQRESKRNYLKSITEKMEAMAFHKLKKNPDNLADGVNSRLRGLIVSDSDPLKLTDLMLGQKIDLTWHWTEKALPVFREMLKPGVEVQFTITLEEECGFGIDDLFAALKRFNDWNNHCFYSKFERPNEGENIVYLGGGVGFSSKTVVDALFPSEDEALQVKDRIFKKTLGGKYREHHHDKDVELGIVPHVCKCTRYQGKLYNVGIGQLTEKKESDNSQKKKKKRSDSKEDERIGK